MVVDVKAVLALVFVTPVVSVFVLAKSVILSLTVSETVVSFVESVIDLLESFKPLSKLKDLLLVPANDSVKNLLLHICIYLPLVITNQSKNIANNDTVA